MSKTQNLNQHARISSRGIAVVWKHCFFCIKSYAFIYSTYLENIIIIYMENVLSQRVSYGNFSDVPWQIQILQVVVIAFRMQQIAKPSLVYTVNHRPVKGYIGLRPCPLLIKSVLNCLSVWELLHDMVYSLWSCFHRYHYVLGKGILFYILLWKILIRGSNILSILR